MAPGNARRESRRPAPRPPRPPRPAAGPARPAPAASPAAVPAAVTRPGGQLYRPRVLADMADVGALRKLRDAGIPALLYGPPGTGKTSLVEAAFPDVITVAGDGDTTVADFTGEYVQRPDGTFDWADGPLITAMREGPVLFIDDTTLISPQVLAVVYPAMDGRREVIVKAHKADKVTAAGGFYVIGGHNPGVHGAVLTEALASRFAVHDRRPRHHPGRPRHHHRRHRPRRRPRPGPLTRAPARPPGARTPGRKPRPRPRPPLTRRTTMTPRPAWPPPRHARLPTVLLVRLTSRGYTALTGFRGNRPGPGGPAGSDRTVCVVTHPATPGGPGSTGSSRRLPGWRVSGIRLSAGTPEAMTVAMLDTAGAWLTGRLRPGQPAAPPALNPRPP
jgi:AAA domain (dynein-related subfamily)